MNLAVAAARCLRCSHDLSITSVAPGLVCFGCDTLYSRAAVEACPRSTWEAFRLGRTPRLTAHGFTFEHAFDHDTLTFRGHIFDLASRPS